MTDGWFVVNVRDAAWVTNEHFGAACIFEGDDAPFAQLGFTIGVLRRGQTGGLYHREASQEDFLVLAGECLLLIEGEERPLQAWDFVHCPPETEHIFVGIGEGPCGRRRDRDNFAGRGVRAFPEVAARTPAELDRVAVGVERKALRRSRCEHGFREAERRLRRERHDRPRFAACPRDRDVVAEHPAARRVRQPLKGHWLG